MLPRAILVLSMAVLCRSQASCTSDDTCPLPHDDSRFFQKHQAVTFARERSGEEIFAKEGALASDELQFCYKDIPFKIDQGNSCPPNYNEHKLGGHTLCSAGGKGPKSNWFNCGIGFAISSEACTMVQYDQAWAVISAVTALFTAFAGDPTGQGGVTFLKTVLKAVKLIGDALLVLFKAVKGLTDLSDGTNLLSFAKTTYQIEEKVEKVDKGWLAWLGSADLFTGGCCTCCEINDDTFKTFDNTVKWMQSAEPEAERVSITRKNCGIFAAGVFAQAGKLMEHMGALKEIILWAYNTGGDWWNGRIKWFEIDYRPLVRLVADEIARLSVGEPVFTLISKFSYPFCRTAFGTEDMSGFPVDTNIPRAAPFAVAHARRVRFQVPSLANLDSQPEWMRPDLNTSTEKLLQVSSPSDSNKGTVQSHCTMNDFCTVFHKVSDEVGQEMCPSQRSKSLKNMANRACEVCNSGQEDMLACFGTWCADDMQVSYAKSYFCMGKCITGTFAQAYRICAEGKEEPVWKPSQCPRTS